MPEIPLFNLISYHTEAFFKTEVGCTVHVQGYNVEKNLGYSLATLKDNQHSQFKTVVVWFVFWIMLEGERVDLAIFVWKIMRSWFSWLELRKHILTERNLLCKKLHCHEQNTCLSELHYNVHISNILNANYYPILSK